MSSELTSLKRMVVDQSSGTRVGFAVVNHSDFVKFFNLTLRDASGNAVDTAILGSAGNRSTAMFVDEMLGVPEDFVGVLEISVHDNSTFTAIGLRFTGSLFTTIPVN